MKPTTSQTEDLRSKFQRELLQGERLLWTGRPGRGLLAPVDALLVPFSLLWGGFALFWELGVLRSGAPLIMPLFGAFFVAMGLYFIIGRFFYKAWSSRRTFYAVTDQRVLVLIETGPRKLRAAFIKQLPTIHKRMRKDGQGTLTFGASTGFGNLTNLYDNTGMDFFGAFYGTPPPTFHGIEDAERVYRLVAEQHRSSTPNPRA